MTTEKDPYLFWCAGVTEIWASKSKGEIHANKMRVHVRCERGSTVQHGALR